MQHRHEVVDVTFPAGDETTEVMQPGEEAFDLPSAAARDAGSGHPA